MSPASIWFYISGHGFGHAIRQIEIIKALSTRDPSLTIAVRTTAPRWLFDRALPGCPIVPGEVDTGVVQLDSLRLDESDTITRAAAFYDDIGRRADEEAALLRRQGASLVVTDAPPLACMAASRAGIPSVVCANFTWDWIYAGYADSLKGAPNLLPVMRDAYASATAGWRMPMHGGFETVPSVVDIPFVARLPRADLTRSAIRRTLGLPIDTPLALVSFGGYGVEGLPLDRLDCTPSWGIVVTGVRSRFFNGSVVGLTNRDLTPGPAGLRYEDLISAVDVVISKPGYGIISDCIANKTALLYTSRGRFAEYDVLVAQMPRYLRCLFIEKEDLRAGAWCQSLDALLALPPPPESPRLDGAHVVVERIGDWIGGSGLGDSD